MTREDIIQMAREAGIQITHEYEDGDLQFGCCNEELERFAQLVDAAAQKRYMQLFLDSENQPTQFGTATQEYREQEIKAEREACREIAGEYAQLFNSHPCVYVADAIRARGQQ